MISKQNYQKFNIYAGTDLIIIPSKTTRESLIKEREIALKNNNYEEWFRISKLIIDEYI